MEQQATAVTGEDLSAVSGAGARAEEIGNNIRERMALRHAQRDDTPLIDRNQPDRQDLRDVQDAVHRGAGDEVDVLPKDAPPTGKAP